MRGLLTGERIILDAIRDTDIPDIEAWFNNTGFMRHYDMIPALPLSSRKVQNLISYYEDSDERFLFAIREKQSRQILGIAGFDEIIWSNGVATVFIGIGSEGHTGKGLGKEAMRLLMDFGFNELNFHRIQLNVISYNETAIKLYEGLGFVKEGILREFIHRDGRRYDMYFYSMLRNEYK